MKTICIWILLAGSLLQGGSALATDTTATVKYFMEKVQQAYKKTPYLSFNLLYRYANKNEPGKYIDTISGEVAMDKNRMRCVLDNIETVCTGNHTIRVVNEEKLIYVSTQAPVAMTDPVQMIDSVLQHFSGVHTQMARNKGLATLTILFPPQQQYKAISMTIDESTGFFQKVVYELYTEGLVEPDQVDQPGKPGIYQPEGIIEVLFSRYRKGQFNDSLFDENRFFTRLGKGNYEPSEKYKDYQVFLASPNL
jgi:hypothetical protein